jgi:hypothetical protein
LADPLSLRRASRPTSLPLADQSACAVRSSSGSFGSQASGLRQALVPSEPSGLLASPTRVGCLGSRLPAAGLPDSHRAHPSAGSVPSTDFRPQSSVRPLNLLPANLRLAPVVVFVSPFSDSLPTYCSFISWTDITDRAPVHASVNQAICVNNAALNPDMPNIREFAKPRSQGRSWNAQSNRKKVTNNSSI